MPKLGCSVIFDQEGVLEQNVEVNPCDTCTLEVEERGSGVEGRPCRTQRIPSLPGLQITPGNKKQRFLWLLAKDKKTATQRGAGVHLGV